MKRLIYFGVVLLMLTISLASCGKSKDPVPSGTSNGGGQPQGNGGY